MQWRDWRRLVGAALGAVSGAALVITMGAPVSAAAPKIVTTFGGEGFGPGLFAARGPMSIAVGRTTFNQNVYVVDTNNNRVEIFDPNGKFIKAFRGEGSNSLQAPYGIAVGPNGDVYVGSNTDGTVFKFNADGDYLARSKPFGKDYTDKQFIYPEDLAVSSRGVLYVGDFGLGRIVEMFSDLRVRSYWNLPLNVPGASGGRLHGLAVTSTGLIYATVGNVIERFDPDGKFLGTWGLNGSAGGQFTTARGIAIGAQDEVYVVDKYAPTGFAEGRVSLIEREGLAGPKFTNTSGPDPRVFNSPTGIAVSRQDRKVYVTNSNSGLVRLLDLNQ